MHCFLCTGSILQFAKFFFLSMPICSERTCMDRHFSDNCCCLVSYINAKKFMDIFLCAEVDVGACFLCVFIVLEQVWNILFLSESEIVEEYFYMPSRQVVDRCSLFVCVCVIEREREGERICVI